MATDSYTRQHSFANQGDTFPFQSLLTFNRAAFNPQSSYVSRKFIATIGYQYEVENGGRLLRPSASQQSGRVPRLPLHTDFRDSLLILGGARRSQQRIRPRASLHVLEVPMRFTMAKVFFRRHALPRLLRPGKSRSRAFDQTSGTDPCFPGNPNLKARGKQGLDHRFFDQKTCFGPLESFRRLFLHSVFTTSSASRTAFLAGLCQMNPSCQFGKWHLFLIPTSLLPVGINLGSEFRPRKWLFINGNYTHDDTRVVKSENPFADPSLEPGKPPDSPSGEFRLPWGQSECGARV